VKILANNDGKVLLKLRDTAPVVQKPAEVILDLSVQGHWIRGFEMIGGMLDFSLQTAVVPFCAKSPVVGVSVGGDRLSVTYDAEADAAYFYVPYSSRFRALPNLQREKMTKYSHSINPTASCAFDGSGGLVSVLIPTADAIGPLVTFLLLFDVEWQSFAAPRLGSSE
jgi:hypothetical protein